MALNAWPFNSRRTQKGGPSLVNTFVMAKQQKWRDQSYAERLRRSLERWPVENLQNGFPDAPTLGRLVDPSGFLWVYRRPLSDSAAKKLAGVADQMIVGDGASNVMVPVVDREVIWTSVSRTGRLPGEEPGDDLEYRPHEFDSESGLTLLYLQRFC